MNATSLDDYNWKIREWKHFHTFNINEEGNGKTTSIKGNNDVPHHVHSILGRIVFYKHNHTHRLEER